MVDYVLNWIKEHDAPTVEAYCELNYSMSWGELRRSDNAEWIAEILDLVESGDLKIATPGSASVQ